MNVLALALSLATSPATLGASGPTNAELREDGGYELREDGGYELRE